MKKINSSISLDEALPFAIIGTLLGGTLIWMGVSDPNSVTITTFFTGTSNPTPEQQSMAVVRGSWIWILMSIPIFIYILGRILPKKKKVLKLVLKLDMRWFNNPPSEPLQFEFEDIKGKKYKAKMSESEIEYEENMFYDITVRGKRIISIGEMVYVNEPEALIYSVDKSNKYWKGIYFPFGVYKEQTYWLPIIYAFIFYLLPPPLFYGILKSDLRGYMDLDTIAFVTPPVLFILYDLVFKIKNRNKK